MFDQAAQIVYLDDHSLIGKGANRYCYFHPAENNKCIKISIDPASKNAVLERKYYQRLVKRQISWAMLSRYYGEVRTNLGKGQVFQLIRDFDERVSKTLDCYLNNLNENTANPIAREDLFGALLLLKAYLCKQKIVVRNLKPYNLVYQRLTKKDGKLVVIDNVGHHNAKPHISDYSTRLFMRDLQKKWKRLESYLP